MDRYRISYIDCGEFEHTIVKAYDYDHAEEKFWDSILEWQGDTGGIEITNILWLKN